MKPTKELSDTTRQVSLMRNKIQYLERKLKRGCPTCNKHRTYARRVQKIKDLVKQWNQTDKAGDTEEWSG